ncbi:PhuW Uncharacterized iron-regulated protein [Burkholderiaceae bacterium]
MLFRRLAPLGTVLWLCACATPDAHWRSQVNSLPTQAPVVLLGEQHDADEHQALARMAVLRLAQSPGLSALVLEMADDGADTAGLPPDTTEAQVRERLRWNDAGWPWQRYGPVVMQAVQLGVPVVGSNLPRNAMGAVMRDEQWDARVPAGVLTDHRERMVSSHCGLLPESQVPGMARIQIARDARMAQTAERWLRPGKTVLLVAGAEHVKRDRGIPLFWSATLAQEVHVLWMRAGKPHSDAKGLADATWATPATPERDHCAEMARPR